MKSKGLAALDRKLAFWSDTKDQHDIDMRNAALVSELLAALEYCNDLIKMRAVKGAREKIALEKIGAAIAKARGA